MAVPDDKISYQTDLKDREIRLIQVQPSTRNDIHCSLVTRSLDDSITYDALSYVWGDASKKRQITCDGKELDVTENLYAALQYISACRPNTLLWVDAVCINQGNVTEKTLQVRMMTKIYAQARQVVIWLGEEEKTDREAYAMAELLAATTYNRDQSNGLPKAMFDPKWKSLANLLTKPWFSRIWVVQEFLMAKSKIFVSGRLEMQPDVIMKAAAQSTSQHPLRSRISANSTSDRLSHPKSVFNGSNLARLAKIFNEHGGCPLLELLYSTRFLQATDRRDKVFALLALSNDITTSLIDYAASAEEVLFTVATQLLSNSDPFLSLVTFLSTAVNNEPSTDRLSWIPDWTSQEFSTYPMIYLRQRVVLVIERSFRIEPSMSLRLKGKVIDKIATIIWPRPYDKPVMGQTKQTAFTNLELIYDWHEQVCQLASASEKYPNGMATNKVLWRALCGDGVTNKQPLGRAHNSAYLAWHTVLEWNRFDKAKFDTTESWNNFKQVLLVFNNFLFTCHGLYTWYYRRETMTWTNLFLCYLLWHLVDFSITLIHERIARLHPSYVPDIATKKKKNKALSKEAGAFEESLSLISEGRRFCKTQKGYLGWVSLNVREGDSMVGLDGFWIPFAVRSLNSNTTDGVQGSMSRRYKLTGDCYLYDLSDGYLKVKEPLEDMIIV